VRRNRLALLASVAIGALTAAACSSSADAPAVSPTDATTSSSTITTDPAPSTNAVATTDAAAPTTVDLIAERFADRPFGVFVPSSVTPGEPAPLLVLLHGYGGDGGQIEDYFGLEPVAQERGILLVHPSGTPDAGGNRFWDAADACCRFESPPVDDSTYLNDILDAVSQRYAVDPDRIWFVGHSNGGFMSYRMACDHADRIAAIVSLAGTSHLDPSLCRPSSAVSILQIHGTQDSVIAFDGGEIFDREYPAVLPTLQAWMQHNQCTGKLGETGTSFDLDAGVDGDETEVLRAGGCPDGVGVELWRIEDGSHSPLFVADYARLVIDFLEAHPKVR